MYKTAMGSARITSLIILSIVAFAAPIHAGTMSAFQDRGGQTTESPTPASYATSGPNFLWRAYASTLALEADAYSQDGANSAQVSAGFSSSRDVVFDYTGIPGFEDWVYVVAHGGLSGSFYFDLGGGVGQANAEITLSGPGVQPFSATGPIQTMVPGMVSAGYSDSLLKGNGETPYLTEVDQSLSVSAWVPRGTAIEITARVVVLAAANCSACFGGAGVVHTAFGNSLDFDPEEFFTINTPGITANSPSLGLVNNQLPNYLVPEPASIVLFVACGLAFFCGSGRYRRDGH